MSIISSILNDELESNHRMQQAYLREISQYPKGSLVIKKRKSVEYFYLAYRDSLNHVKTDYIGLKESSRIIELTHQIEKRKEILIILKKLKIEECRLIQILKHDL